MDKVDARTNRGQRAKERICYELNFLRILHTVLTIQYVLCIYCFTGGTCDVCFITARMLCFKGYKNIQYILICETYHLEWVRSERESILRSRFIQTYSSASEPAAAQGVRGCMSSSSKATQLSGQLKQAQGLASSYKEPVPGGGDLFDGEVIKMDGHPANYL